MLQAALILLGYALSNHLFFINKVVGSVVIGFSTWGLLSYFLIVFVATLSYNCPFQTPLPLTLRFLIRFDSEHKGYLKQSREWIKNIFSQVKRLLRLGSGHPCSLGGLGSSSGNDSSLHIELPMVKSPNQLPMLFDSKIDWDSHVMDSNCIAWMFEMSMDMDVATAIASFIPEIVWHRETQAIPLERLYDIVLKCFDNSFGHPVLKPTFRNTAYLSVKALLHVSIQQWCMSGETIPNIESITRQEQIFDSGCYGGDSDLESTLGLLSCVYDGGEHLYWDDFSFTVPHHTWLGHILLYNAWDFHRRHMCFPHHLEKFVLHSLRLEPPPPAPIIADCLFIIGSILGIKLHVNDLSVIDKRLVDFSSVLYNVSLRTCYSHEINHQITRIYVKLAEAFTGHTSSTDGINHALAAMRLMAPLSKSSIPPPPEDDIASPSKNNIGQKSYDLFHITMKDCVCSIHTQETQFMASQLAMYGAYKWGGVIEDPHDILTFLNLCFDLATNDSHNWYKPEGGPFLNHDESIHQAIHVLANASGPITIEALKNFNPTEHQFVCGIYYALQADQPLQLRSAAFSFLPLISDKWFSSPNTITDHSQMRSFCVDWASVVDAIELTDDVKKAALTVFLEMINSDHWRPHVVVERWKLLEHISLVLDDSWPLKKCINNPKLTDEIRDMEDPAVLAF